MKLSNEVKTALLGIVAIALLIFGYSFLKGKNPFSSDRIFYAKYDNVEGLTKSSAVTINGFQVGSVTDITFLNASGELLVKMNVKDEFQFSKQSVARIYGGNLIGGKSIEIIPEEGKQLAVSEDTLKSAVGDGLLELVNERLTPLQQKIESAVSNADSLLIGMNNILDAKAQESIKSSIASLNTTMSSFNNSAKSIEHLLASNTGKLNNTFTNLEETTGNFQKFSDTLAQVNVNGLIAEIQDIAENFKEISEKLNTKEGTVGKLLNDDKIYDNLDRATRQLDLLLQDVKLNPKRYVHFSVFGKKQKQYTKPEDSLK